MPGTYNSAALPAPWFQVTHHNRYWSIPFFFFLQDCFCFFINILSSFPGSSHGVLVTDNNIVSMISFKRGLVSLGKHLHFQVAVLNSFELRPFLRWQEQLSNQELELRYLLQQIWWRSFDATASTNALAILDFVHFSSGDSLHFYLFFSIYFLFIYHN